jgi:o-succinylbenzoate synthase
VRLSEARAFPLRLRLTRPLVTAAGEFAVRESVILELRDADGVRGLGEASPWPGFGSETPAGCRTVLERAVPLLRGATLQPAEWPLDLVMLMADAPVARAALEAALCDLAARRAAGPLAAYLHATAGLASGAAVPGDVAINALLVEREPEALRAESARVREAGFLAAKLKVGGGPLVGDIARVRAARDGLGPQVALRLDANGSWSEAQAREALGALAPFRPDHVEQPVPAGEVEAMARLRAEGMVRLAADESLSLPGGLQRVIDLAAADVLVLKPSLLGGPLAALAAARRAREAGCGIVFTHVFESAIGRYHALHCAAAWADPEAVHGLAGGSPFRDDVGALPAAGGGRLVVGQAPGLGFEVDGARWAEGEDP